MKISKSRIKEIIKEEIKNILLEKRIRLRNSDVDVIFHSKDDIQLVGRKGMLRLSRQDAKAIKYAVQNHLSIYA